MQLSRRNLFKAVIGAGLLCVEARASQNPELQDSAGQRTHLQIQGGVLEVLFPPEHFDVSRAALLEWISTSARAVTGYFGKFPVDRATVRIRWDEGRRGVLRGRSFGENGAYCEVTVGEHATETDLQSDWVMTHEMIHFGFPSVAEPHHWIEEGSATYIEPIARAKIGGLNAKQVWSDMIRNMPQGLPKAGDQGLDKTHTWGRTYWGGAIFCLLADVRIRKNTANKKGLEDAVRAINRAGGNITAEWPLRRALAVGCKATDGSTLLDLYRRMALKPEFVDLPALWRELGVSQTSRGIVFDGNAPLARIRDAILPYTGIDRDALPTI